MMSAYSFPPGSFNFFFRWKLDLVCLMSWGWLGYRDLPMSFSSIGDITIWLTLLNSASLG